MSAPCSWACSVSSTQSFADVRARARLDHGVGRDGARLVDRDLDQLLALVHRQRPPLGDAAREPQHVVAEIADAVAHEGAVRVAVDVVAVGAAERRVERVADSVQPPRRPTLASRAVDGVPPRCGGGRAPVGAATYAWRLLLPLAARRSAAGSSRYRGRRGARRGRTRARRRSRSPCPARTISPRAVYVPIHGQGVEVIDFQGHGGCPGTDSEIRAIPATLSTRIAMYPPCTLPDRIGPLRARCPRGLAASVGHHDRGEVRGLV